MNCTFPQLPDTVSKIKMPLGKPTSKLLEFLESTQSYMRWVRTLFPFILWLLFQVNKSYKVRQRTILDRCSSTCPWSLSSVICRTGLEFWFRETFPAQLVLTEWRIRNYNIHSLYLAWRTLLVYTSVTPCLTHDSRSRKGTVFVPKHAKKTCKGTD